MEKAKEQEARAAQEAIQTVEGLWNVITHAIETFKGLVYFFQHPVETAKSIWESIKSSWNNDVVNGNADIRSNWLGALLEKLPLSLSVQKASIKR
jgi:predicted ribonuclease toxin of YeeF-YezG toxin-antitoxin module